MNADLVCAYCGKPDPETRDHIPPRSLFPRPWPNNLITVPCCEKCRDGTSYDDEYFRAVILTSETIGDDPRVAHPLASAARALQKPSKVAFQRMILRSMTYTDVVTESGIFLRKAMKIDPERINNVIERIFRGLFYREFGIPVPGDRSLRVQLDQHGLRAKEITEWAGGWVEPREAADGMFAYTYTSVIDFDHAGIWLGLLYDAVTLIGFVGPDDTHDTQQQDL